MARFTSFLLRILSSHGGWISLLIGPLLAIWPVYFGMSADPIYLNSGLLRAGRAGWVAGAAHLDLNVGATTQALGHLAAEQWLRGDVPWWNFYNGLGLPLAGEMQASALFLPFVLLLHFQNGPLLIKLALQMIAGPATYRLLRGLGIAPSVAWLGGVVFALNGSFAWFGHGPIMPLAFLPLLLLGIENARSGGHRLIALALALSLYAGFPETAYLDGLLGLVWAIWRGWQSEDRMRFVRCVMLGGVLGLLMAAPALWSFAHTLLHGLVGGHGIDATGPPPAGTPEPIYAVWLFPYLLGPLLQFISADPAGEIGDVVSNLGGYLGMVGLLLTLASLGGAHLRGLRWVLAGWIALCVLRTANVPIVRQVVNAIPLVAQTIFPRYAIASWHFAAVILLALTLSDWSAGRLAHRRVRWAALGALGAAGFGLALAWPLVWRLASHALSYRIWPVLSVVWGVSSAGMVAALLLGPATRMRRVAMLVVLLVDTSAMFSLPLLSGPRGAEIDRSAVAFLHDHLGVQRFYSLGPYRPNYGAYFETAQLTDEYLPVPAMWASVVKDRLDPSADAIMFRGTEPPMPPGPRDHVAQFIHYQANYEALAVRYLLTPPGDNPFIPSFASAAAAPRVNALVLQSGQSVAGQVEAGLVPAGRIETVHLELGTYHGSADGQLVMEVCQAEICSQGELDLKAAYDNAPAGITLHSALPVTEAAPLRWQLRHEGGAHAVALWLPGGPDSLPRLRFDLHSDQPIPARVYRDAVMDIYALPNAAPYFEAIGAGCRLDYADRSIVAADCAGPAMLVRRELFYDGWRAWVNDAESPIAAYQLAMQQTPLPAGHSITRFDYAPPYAGVCWALMGVGVLGLWPRLRRIDAAVTQL